MNKSINELNINYQNYFLRFIMVIDFIHNNNYMYIAFLNLHYVFLLIKLHPAIDQRSGRVMKDLFYQRPIFKKDNLNSLVIDTVSLYS
jgi:hypothetical protein